MAGGSKALGDKIRTLREEKRADLIFQVRLVLRSLKK